MIYHIIDHKGEGSIHKLILPLSQYEDSKIILLDTLHEGLPSIPIDDVIIVHSSGSAGGRFAKEIRHFFPFHRHIYIFMHTSVEYQRLKGRLDFLYKLKSDNIIMLTPSIEVSRQYTKFGFKTKTVQIGIPPINSTMIESKDELRPFYYKYITTCTSNNELYAYIKGIDLFEEMMQDIKLHTESLICGQTTCSNIINIQDFSLPNFINVLAHARAYIQLSRLDTYNITAIQAKQLKIPTLILKTEGTASCMRQYAYQTIEDISNEIKNLSNGVFNHDIIEELYEDSIHRESLDNFHKSLTSIILNDE